MELGMHNYMEDIVQSRMEVILKTMPDICQCERCKLDMLAYALNNSPPKYVVTTKGKLYAKLNALEGQFDTDIVRVITDAAIRVDQNPRHDEENEL
jgi:competence protein ComFB